MPDYVVNRILFAGPDNDLVELHNLLNTETDKTGEGFNLNAVVPMPPELDIPADTRVLDGAAAYLLEHPEWGDKEHLDGTYTVDFCRRPLSTPERAEQIKKVTVDTLNGPVSAYELGAIYLQNCVHHGYGNWHEWRIARWGTRWDVSSARWIDDDNLVVLFDTAYDPPIPVIKELSNQFPRVRMIHEWAGHDFGRDTGRLEVLQGVVLSGARIPDDSVEARYLARDLWYGGETPEHMIETRIGIYYKSEIESYSMEQRYHIGPEDYCDTEAYWEQKYIDPREELLPGEMIAILHVLTAGNKSLEEFIAELRAKDPVIHRDLLLEMLKKEM